MLWVNPWISAKRQQVMSSDEATLHLIQTLIPGRLQPSPDGRHVMYVERMSRDRTKAENVFMAHESDNPDNPDQGSWMLLFASQGYQMKDKPSQETYFVTTDGYRYEGTVGQNEYKIIRFKKYAVRIPQNDVHVTHQQGEVLSISQLWDDYANPKSAAELQWRLSISLSAFLLAMLAVTMSSVRPRQGRYMRLLPAGLIYVVYVNLLFVARRWVEQGSVSVPIGIWWVHALVLAAILLTLSLRPKV
jgi:lipopolysaccharide export system permease protein